MDDVLRRLHRALPKMRDWLDVTLAAHAPITVPVSTLKFSRLSTWYPAELLDLGRIAVVPTIPRPPVAEFGVPEFESMTTMEIAGITYRDMFFAQDGQVTESLCFHELIHIVQWATLGVNGFLLTYGLGILQHGYAGSPLEAIAFAAQAAFEAGTAFPDLVPMVAQHALAERATASVVYAAHGLAIDG